jgi:hypothetical protein
MNMLPSHSIDTAVIKMQERNVETCQYDLSTMAVGLLFHHNCKVQCCMVIALIFRSIAKYLKLGGGQQILPAI